jgi:hypothetical protein
LTTETFADLVGAQRTGAGRWKARCPAHADRSPSLSIRAGQDGRVLAHCFGGCTLDAILAALGLSSRDLFAGPPPSAEQVRLSALQRRQMNAERAAIRRERAEIADRYRRLTALVEAIGDRLARLPDDAPAASAITGLFHTAIERQHEVETELEAPL